MSELLEAPTTGFRRAKAARDRSVCTGPPRLEGSTAVIVLGMHRSGTSALAGALHHLGVELGDRLMPASPANPRGYWEHRDIVAVNDKLMAGLGWSWDDIRPLPAGWEDSEAALGAGREAPAILARDFAGARLWGLKDPRLCRLMPLWVRLCDRLELNPRFILMVRHPCDVAASLAARDGLSPARGGILWLRHSLEAELATRSYPRTVVNYEDLVGHLGWRDVVSRISGELDLAWPAGGPSVEAAIDAYLAPELRHHHTGNLAPEGFRGWLEEVYRAFLSADPVRLQDTCNAVNRELDRAGSLFLPIIAEATNSLAKARAEQHAQASVVGQLSRRLVHAEREAATLRKAKALPSTAAPGLRGVAPASPRGRGLSPMDRRPRVERSRPIGLDHRTRPPVALPPKTGPGNDCASRYRGARRPNTALAASPACWGLGAACSSGRRHAGTVRR